MALEEASLNIILSNTEDLKIKVRDLSKKLGASPDITLDTISNKIEKIKSPPVIG